MVDRQATSESLERRIRRLERNSRLFGVGTLTVLLLGGAAVSMGYVSDEPKPIEASGMVLRDAQGGVYARFEHVEAQGGALTLTDDHGASRIRIGVGADGTPAVTLSDSSGHQLVELSILDNATPRILLRDKRETERAKLLLMPDGSPLLYLKDEKGTNRVELASLWTGLSGLAIFDEAGRLRGLVSALPHQRHGMVWLDPEGNPAVQVGLTADGRPIVTGLDGPATGVSETER